MSREKPTPTGKESPLGDDELIVMLWASEIFDPARPDTFAAIVRE